MSIGNRVSRETQPLSGLGEEPAQESTQELGEEPTRELGEEPTQELGEESTGELGGEPSQERGERGRGDGRITNNQLLMKKLGCGPA